MIEWLVLPVVGGCLIYQFSFLLNRLNVIVRTLEKIETSLDQFQASWEFKNGPKY